jgi:hypothetical protein
VTSSGIEPEAKDRRNNVLTQYNAPLAVFLKTVMNFRIS